MSDIIAKMMDLEAEINADIDDLVDLKTEITAAIKALDNSDYAMVLELRYLCFDAWDAIIDCMGYSRPHVFRLHEAALEAIKVPLNTKSET
jgi:DNA-directed RNA polymerase specialized sigma subunit